MIRATKRVLPADVYDTLELSALAYRGIGAGWYTTNRKHVGFGGGREDVPLCIYGHAYAATNDNVADHPIVAALVAALIYSLDNDHVVAKLARGRRRISFAKWCAELGVERGA